MIPAISNNTHTFPQIYKNNTLSFGANPANFDRFHVDMTPIYDRLTKQQKISFISKIIQKIKLRKAVKNLVSDIPKQLQSEARELARKNIRFNSKNKPFYRPQNFEGLCLPPENTVENKRIVFKLDLLSELDPSLYVGSHTHPINYISGTKGYECFDRLGFENFEKAIDLKLYEFVLLSK